MRAIVLCLVLLAVTGCVGVIRDYATAVNAYAEDASEGTRTQLARKHDTELQAYLAAACAQPRIGALMRRYRDDELLEYVKFCRGQRS